MARAMVFFCPEFLFRKGKECDMMHADGKKQGRTEKAMSRAEAFRAALAEYDAAVRAVQKNRKMFDGVLGMGTHPGNAPCHDVLDRRTGELCREAASDPDPSELSPFLRELYAAAKRWEGPEYARLMLVALHRHTLPLIPLLAAEERAALSEWYQQAYPRRQRLPVQDQLLKELKKNN